MLFFPADRGRLAEGVAQAKLAVESDPLSSYAHAIYGLACAIAGKCEEGIAVARRAVGLDPESYLARMCLTSTLYLGGFFDEFLAANEFSLAISGRHPWSLAGPAVAFADSGKPSDAEALYAEMLARARRQYMSPALLALAASAAGREDEAICHASKAFEIRDPVCQVYFSRHLGLRGRLDAYPRLRELLSEVGFE